MSGDGRPTLRVVRGDATSEEIAALTAVLAARAAAAARAERAGRAKGRVAVPGWRDRRRLMRQPVLRGPGGWRSSAAPR